MFASSIDPGSNDGVGVAFTDRLGGVSAGPLGALNLGRTDVDDPAAVAENMRRVLASLSVSRVVALNQVHGTRVVVVAEQAVAEQGPDDWLGDALQGRQPLAVADAVVTACTDLALAIRVADCVPVLLADTQRRLIGAAHAGRVGLLGGLLTRTVEQLRALGAEDLQAWIGPHICGGCYEVPDELASEVARTRPQAVAATSWGTRSLDLGAACAQELATLGVRVQRDDPCTYENDSLYSHRRQGGLAGRQVGLIWMSAKK